VDLLGLFIVAGCTIALAIMTWRGVRSRGALRRLLAAGPLRPLHGLKAGRVYVRGRAQAMRLLTAPLSGALVIGFRVMVERRDTHNEWTRLLDHWELADFELHEENCAAVVRGAEAVLLITEEAAAPDPGTDEVVALLEKHCQFTPTRHDTTRMRCSEFHLEDGQAVFAAGEAEITLARDGRLAQGSSAYRATPTQLQLWGSTRRPLLVCDRSREALLLLLGSTVGAERFVPLHLFQR